MSRYAQLATFIILGLAVWLGFATAGPPRAVPATAPPSQFSAARALEDLQVVARAPHPVGSEEHDAVRDALVARLVAFGLADVHVQDATGFNTLGGTPRAASVANIVARKRGARSSGALLLTAHYDAVPRSFGAADDGAGVAAILETLRALGASPPLRNDLIVVLTDAEEPGLLGAEAFVNLDPWAKDVRAVLNFDARGTSGAGFMFQTSNGNGALIDLLAANVPDARANSLTGEVYRHLPSDTDLSIWLHSPFTVAALNFAFIDGYTHYHTPLDNLATLSLRSLQHYGDYALPLSRALGQIDLNSLRRADDVYFNAPLVGLVRYPESWALPLAIVLVISCGVWIVVAMRRNQLTAKGVVAGAIALVGILAVPTATAYVGWHLISTWHPAYADILQHDPYNSSLYLLGFAALTLGIAVALQFVAAKRATPIELAVAPFVLWSVVGVVVALRLPGASYLFTWPFLAALIGGAIALPRSNVAVALFGAPALILFLPLIASLEVALTASFMAGAVLLLTLVFALLVIQLQMVGSMWRGIFPLCLMAAAGSFALAEAKSGFTAERKQPDSLLYLLDADAGTAWWISFDRTPDAWTTQALGANPTRRAFARYHLGSSGDSWFAAPVEAAPIPAPEIQLLAKTATVGGRRVHLKLGLPGGAEEFSIYAMDSSVRVSDVVLNGRTLSAGGTGPYAPRYTMGPQGKVLTYYGVPSQGIDLWLTINTPAPVAFLLSGSTEGFPTVSSAPSPRLPSFMSKPFIPTDVTMVDRIVRF